MTKNDFLSKNKCFKIIGSCIAVHSKLDYSFSEAIYQKALECELGIKSIPYERKSSVDIQYKKNLFRKKYVISFVIISELLRTKLVRLLCPNSSRMPMEQIESYYKQSKLQPTNLSNRYYQFSMF